MKLSDTIKLCFWFDAPGRYLVDNTWLCERHAHCAQCNALLHENLAPVGCVCADYGYSQHEEALYCSMECMETAHEVPTDSDDEEALHERV